MEKLEIDDLLIAVLLQLPRKSIFRFMCVSKRWNNILNDPFFFHSYIIARKGSSNCPLAFIAIQNFTCSQCHHPAPGQQLPMKILPVLGQTNNHEIEQVPKQLGYFIGCSDGLILCGHRERKYYVLNPVKRTCVSLPLPKVKFFPSMGLVCTENINNNGHEPACNFKVVCADITSNYTNTLSIKTYCSNTGKWMNSTLIATGKFQLQAFKPPFVFNGVFHWFSWNDTLAIYDSNVCDNHMQLIVLPKGYNNDEEIFSTVVTRSSSDNGLWFGINKRRVLEFWMLPNVGYKRSTTIPGTEWILMHKITHESVRQDVMCVHRKSSIKRKSCVHGTVDDDYIEESFVDLEWLIPGNPFVVVLRLDGLICLYNLETKIVELVRYDDRYITDLEDTESNCSWYPYMPPLSMSSYAL